MYIHPTPSVPSAPQPGLRALPSFTEIPSGHLTFPITDDRFYPHLDRGEFAVIYLSDREPQRGELFLIAYGASDDFSGVTYRLCGTVARQVRTPEGEIEGWFARHGLYGPVWAEGPMTRDHIAAKLIGRVQGVFIPFGGEAHE
ncbi:hypothetical protein [Ancylobacter sp. FA202]|uniref:hypothetical protein n=1 Tax=Ancylobacter sp. FA202 TaxID=1111106 RepID=UPI000362BF44|nr:hypothetical protein [Ancylobacter sp. FA202]